MREGATSPLGIVLTGGGARGAYQAGVLRGLHELCAELDASTCFDVLVGTSAGAINAAFLAAHADDLAHATRRLVEFWSELRAEQVYRTDVLTLGKIGVRWLAELSLDGLIEEKHANALLDTRPLRALLEGIPFARIEDHTAAGRLRGLAVTAADLCCGESVTYFAGPAEPWRRNRRRSEPARIALEHIYASASIPVLFPPVAHGGHYLSDGSVRNYAPVSPAIKLGARRVVVVGVRSPTARGRRLTERPPSIARIAGTILDAVLLDAVDLDLERIERLNQAAHACRGGPSPWERVDAVLLRPSRDVAEMALEEFSSLPRTLRHLIGGLGSPNEAAELISYLLFEPPFAHRLIEMGRRDVRAQAHRLVPLLLGDG
ncbi:MAG: patatin-like phospholipase family protein [Planctomycetota bacterium]|nr:MAG: patatin-like phospholipase family protein [Planctomycetota bacterium]